MGIGSRGYTAETRPFRTEPASWRRVLTLDDVFRAIRRRWRLVAGVFLLACIGVGVFIYARVHDKPPVRFRSVVTVQVAPGSAAPAKSKSKSRSNQTTTTAAPIVQTSAATKLALAPTTRAQALKIAGVPANTRGIIYAARLLPDNHFIALDGHIAHEDADEQGGEGLGYGVCRRSARRPPRPPSSSSAATSTTPSRTTGPS